MVTTTAHPRSRSLGSVGMFSDRPTEPDSVLRSARVLSTILVGLLAVASFAGLLIDDLYRDPDAVRAV